MLLLIPSLALPTPRAPVSLDAHASVTKLDRFTGCPDGQRNVGEDECSAAVKAVAQGLELPVRSGLKVVDVGVEGLVPSGCSYSRHSELAVFNRKGGGGESQNYELVCFAEQLGEKSSAWCAVSHMKNRTTHHGHGETWLWKNRCVSAAAAAGKLRSSPAPAACVGDDCKNGQWEKPKDEDPPVEASPAPEDPCVGDDCKNGQWEEPKDEDLPSEASSAPEDKLRSSPAPAACIGDDCKNGQWEKPKDEDPPVEASPAPEDPCVGDDCKNGQWEEPKDEEPAEASPEEPKDNGARAFDDGMYHPPEQEQGLQDLLPAQQEEELKLQPSPAQAVQLEPVPTPAEVVQTPAQKAQEEALEADQRARDAAAAATDAAAAAAAVDAQKAQVDAQKAQNEALDEEAEKAAEKAAEEQKATTQASEQLAKEVPATSTPSSDDEAAPPSNNPKHSDDWNAKENAKRQQDAIEEDQRKREADAAADAQAATQAAADAQKEQRAAMDKTAAESAQVAKEQAEKAAEASGVPVPATPDPVVPTSIDPGYDGTGCKDEKCANKARALKEHQDAARAKAAEKKRVEDEDKRAFKDAQKAEGEMAQTEKKTEKDAADAAKRAAEANKAATVDPIKARDWDPNVVCVSFNEEVKLDWCYAACTDGVCPTDAAANCMCAKGGDGQASSKQQQQSKGAQQQSKEASPEQQQQQTVPEGTGNGLPATGTDWASGAKLPTPASANADPVSLSCAAVEGGSVSDAWCETTCKPAGGGIANCPEDLCSCEDTAERVWWSRFTTGALEPEKMYFGSRYEVSREMAKEENGQRHVMHRP